jgi:hypothetical protein
MPPPPPAADQLPYHVSKPVICPARGRRAPRATPEWGGWTHNGLRLYWQSVFESISDFEITIAITIPIKNRSGKIADRFSDRIRSAISGSKSISGFHFQIDQRLKTGFRAQSTDRTQNRIPIFVRKSISDFDLRIDQRFTF